MRGWPLLVVAGCAVDLDDRRVEPGLEEVRWSLAWDAAGVERSAAGWCTTTDLGHEVCVDDGVVVTAMASLVACEDVVARNEATRFSLVPTAWASHAGDMDPSAWTGGRVEDLVGLGDVAVATVPVAGDRYCRAHWAVDAAWEGTEGLDDDALIGTSLRVAGRVRGADGRWRRFAIASDLAWGELQDVAALEVADGAVEVRVVRSVAGLLDGVDFEGSLEGADVVVLRNLAAGTRFEVVGG